jgi:hypothetical protein
MDAQKVLTVGRGIARFSSQIWMTTVPQKGDFILAPPIAAFKVFGTE